MQIPHLGPMHTTPAEGQRSASKSGKVPTQGFRGERTASFPAPAWAEIKPWSGDDSNLLGADPGAVDSGALGGPVPKSEE